MTPCVRIHVRHHRMCTCHYQLLCHFQQGHLSSRCLTGAVEGRLLRDASSRLLLQQLRGGLTELMLSLLERATTTPEPDS